MVSVNDEFVHGIPGPRRRVDGDLVKLDVTLEKDGFIADVLMPHGTRRRVAHALRWLADKKVENPWKKHGNIPL